MSFVSFKVPSRAEQVSRIMSICRKREDTPMMCYLTVEEMRAVIDSVDQTSFSGSRDFVLWSVMYNTGARVSEALSMKKSDLKLDGRIGSVKIMGKGRKLREMPLWASTVKILRNWMARPELAQTEMIFINRDGDPMTRSGVEDRLEMAVKIAQEVCPSLKNKNVSPHTIRHTTAMHLLKAGVKITVIALWLGHASPKTTHIYVEADIEMKEKALARLQTPNVRSVRYKANDSTLAFLQSL